MKKILLFTCVIFLSLTTELFAQPINLTTTNILATSADLNWDASPCGGNVTLHYKVLGTSWAGTAVNPALSPFALTGLNPNTSYQWRVKCSGTSNWSSIENFSTGLTGCTDALACNYDSAATIDDGSCTMPGCTNTSAANYDPSAGCDDGSCIIPTIATAFISQPILCNGGFATDEMQIDVNQTAPATVYSCVVGQLFSNGYFLSYLSTNQTTTASLNLQGFNPNVDYCVRIVDSAAYYSGNDIGFGGSASGTSTVGVYDEFCSINFSEPAQLVATTSVVASNQCAGDCIAAEDLIISGGTGPFSFTLNGGTPIVLPAGDSTYSFTGLCAGTYDIIVTDANGCSTSPSTTTFIIAPIASISPTGSVSVFNLNGYHVSCNGANDGSITANASGGTGTFTYSIDGINFQSNALFSGLIAGNYTITYKDANNCTATEAHTLNEPPALSGTANITQVVDCFGASTGAITFDVDVTQPGVPPYQYSTDNGSNYQSSNVFSNLSGNITYDVMIEDNNGCQYTSSIYLAEPAQIIYSPILSNYNGFEITCNGAADGSIDFGTPIGGTAPLEYSIDNGSSYLPALIFTSLVAGSYDLIIRDSNLCIEPITVVLEEPGIFTIPATVTNPISCYEDDNGSVTISPANAVGQVTYTFEGTPQTDSIFTGLEGDITNPTPYVIDATDDNGCIAQETVSLSEPTDFVYSPLTSTDEYCLQSNGTASINVTSGGTGGYSYSWNDGQTSATATGLIAGNYHVTVTDGNGCTLIENIYVGTDIGFTVSFTTVEPCLGPNSGSATVFATGTSPYTYQWLDVNGDTIIGATLATIDNIPVGTYSVVVEDATTCQVTGVLDVNIPANPIQIDSIIIFENSCFGINDAQIEILASGGQSPYSYSSTGGLNIQINPVFSNLSPGSYTIWAIDANGCYADSIIPLTYPDQLVIDSTVFTNISCFGEDDGAIQDIIFTGGTAPFEYSINGVTFQSYPLFNDLEPGWHTVEIFDINNGVNGITCATSDQILITEPTPLNATLTPSDWNNYQVLCNGGHSGYLDVTASGGTLPYYTIFNQFYTSPNFTVNGTTLDTAFFSLNSVYIYSWDSNANILDSTITDSLTILHFNDANNPTNPTDTLYAFESGFWNMEFDSVGTIIDSTYLYADSTWLLSYYYLSAIDTAFGANSQMTGFPQGNHTFVVEDANGCAHTETIMYNEPTPIDILFSPTHVSCVAWSDGAVTALVSGGVGTATSYTYLWDNGATTYSIDNLSAGTYSITVTDIHGCSSLGTVDIFDNNALSVGPASVVNVGCFGECDGEITLTVNGGVPFTGSTLYNYQWNDYLNQTTNPAVGLCADSVSNTQEYICVITDAQGCELIDTVSITQNNELIVQSEIIDAISCFGEADGKIKATVTGGNPVYNYTWSNGITDLNTNNITSQLSGLEVGSYIVEVEDNNGCKDTAVIYLYQPDSLQVTITDIDIDCFAGGTGSIEALANGGTPHLGIPPQYEYTWLNESGTTISTVMVDNDMNAEITGLVPGFYTVKVVDLNGCTVISESVSITEPSDGLEMSVDYFDEACDISAYATVYPVGGTPPYLYDWGTGNGPANNSTQNLVAGSNTAYTVTLIDDNDCEITEEIFVSGYQNVFMPGFLDAVGPYTICLGQDIDIDIDEREGLTYTWSDGVITGDRNIYTDSILAYDSTITTTYTLTIKDNANCSQDVEVVVTYSADVDPEPLSDPSVDVGDFPVVLSGESIEIYSDNNNCSEYNWTWSLDTVSEKSVTVSPQESGWYYVDVKDFDGCVGYDSIYVVVGVKPYEAITPNDDGYNDTWTPLDIVSYKDALVQVFNRWGGLVFESKGGDSYNPWDGQNQGKELAVGTYYYIIDLNTGDAPQTGPITIIR